MKKIKSLTWNERLAIIEHFNPSDDVICSTFEVNQNELNTARQMMKTGTLTPSTSIDVASYSPYFSTNGNSIVKPNTKASQKQEGLRPETASKKSLTLKKRGRKGDKIAKAFAAIPATPTTVNTFIEEHSISLAVLRQSTRFDTSPRLGKVRVKKDKQTGNLMVWRETNNQ